MIQRYCCCSSRIPRALTLPSEPLSGFYSLFPNGLELCLVQALSLTKRASSKEVACAIGSAICENYFALVIVAFLSPLKHVYFISN